MGLDQEVEFLEVDDPRWFVGNEDDSDGRVSPVDPPPRESAPVESKQPAKPPKPKVVKVKPAEKGNTDAVASEPEPKPEPEPEPEPAEGK